MGEGTDMIENVARANLIDELALSIDQFLSHQIERDTLACDLTQDELTELSTGLVAIAAWNTRASDAEIARLTSQLRAAEERVEAGQPPIWPLGCGVVMVAHTIEQGTPLFFMRAMPDDLADTPGDKSTNGVWEKTANAPTVTLAFADVAAIESHIASLQALVDAARAALKEQPHADA